MHSLIDCLSNEVDFHKNYNFIDNYSRVKN